MAKVTVYLKAYEDYPVYAIVREEYGIQLGQACEVDSSQLARWKKAIGQYHAVQEEMASAAIAAASRAAAG